MRVYSTLPTDPDEPEFEVPTEQSLAFFRLLMACHERGWYGWALKEVPHPSGDPTLETYFDLLTPEGRILFHHYCGLRLERPVPPVSEVIEAIALAYLEVDSDVRVVRLPG
jgi:hypothetical protein